MLVITLICLLKIESLKLRFNSLGGIVVRTTIEMITTMLAVCSTPLNNITGDWTGKSTNEK
jgi:hypothetical protein